MNPEGKPTYTYKFIDSLINKMPLLKEWYENGGSPKIYKYSAWDKDMGSYDYVSKDVSLNFKHITTNFQLVSTMFHEFFHAYQDVQGHVKSAISEFGGLTDGSKTEAILEVAAYRFQYNLGDNSALEGYRRYLRRIHR